jgi:hypothetical protein
MRSNRIAHLTQMSWHPLVRDERQERRDPQQESEEVRELSKEANRGGSLREALDTIRPELEPSCGGICV